ncbi:MAG: diaminopimelate epimerase [Acidobacteria bacterium]|nr:MAG: diaminopimelate epimerase [Acidobacteriota bacterium]
MAMEMIHADAHGNDFLLVNEADVPPGTDRGALARRVCLRTPGPGADGLIFYTHGVSSTRMQLRNADGSYSEVSGNGVRCLGASIAERRNLADGAQITIDTDAGAKVLTLLERAGRRFRFRTSMGHPINIRRLILDVGGQPVNIATLNVGNPQCVVLDRCDDASLRQLGGALAVHPHFPEGTNVEFLRVDRPDHLTILIWERGVGPTASSGTGTCAAAVAAACFAGARRDVEVTAPGGTQRVEWRDDGLWLTGWAEVMSETAI